MADTAHCSYTAAAIESRRFMPVTGRAGNRGVLTLGMVSDVSMEAVAPCYEKHAISGPWLLPLAACSRVATVRETGSACEERLNAG
jgi:hypothetical protein